MILDLHIHSKYSFDSILEPKKIIKVAKKKGLDGVAITDHNTIKGGLEAKKINEDQDFLVIVGSEISTDIGDITGLFLNEEIKSRNSMEVIEEIKEQGGIVVLPHPCRGHKLNDEIVKRVDAIEGFNARTNKENNMEAVKLAEKYNKPIVAGSDAHFASEIGFAKTDFRGSISSDIRSSFLSNKIEITGNQSPWHLTHISQMIKSAKNKELKRIPFQLINLIYQFTKVYNYGK